MNIYAYIQICICIHAYTYIYMYINVYIRIYEYASIDVNISVTLQLDGKESVRFKVLFTSLSRDVFFEFTQCDTCTPRSKLRVTHRHR